MTIARYRGYRILAQPYQLAGSKRWTVDFAIHRHGQRKSFNLIEHYVTEKEADARCLRLGRDIIDDRIPGRSIGHLRIASGRLGRRVMLLAAIVLLALGTLALRVDQVNSHPALVQPVRLVGRGVHAVSRELRNIGEWLFDRLVAAPVIGEASLE